MAIRGFNGEYFFLSNFYFHRRGETVEHMFQASKNRDSRIQDVIWKQKSPGDAKRAGRNIPLRKDWEQVKVDIMYNCLCNKFAIPELRIKLLATGDQDLEESNTWHDNFWGNCTCHKCRKIEGQNMLGKLLMRVRTELKE